MKKMILKNCDDELEKNVCLKFKIDSDNELSYITDIKNKSWKFVCKQISKDMNLLNGKLFEFGNTDYDFTNDSWPELINVHKFKLVELLHTLDSSLRNDYSDENDVLHYGTFANVVPLTMYGVLDVEEFIKYDWFNLISNEQFLDQRIDLISKPCQYMNFSERIDMAKSVLFGDVLIEDKRYKKMNKYLVFYQNFLYKKMVYLRDHKFDDNGIYWNFDSMNTFRELICGMMTAAKTAKYKENILFLATTLHVIYQRINSYLIYEYKQIVALYNEFIYVSSIVEDQYQKMEQETKPIIDDYIVLCPKDFRCEYCVIPKKSHIFDKKPSSIDIEIEIVNGNDEIISLKWFKKFKCFRCSNLIVEDTESKSFFVEKKKRRKKRRRKRKRRKRKRKNKKIVLA